MTQPLIDILDARYPNWSMYRTAMKDWMVKLDAPAHADIVRGSTPEEALQAAVDFKCLPVIPRRPDPMNRADITVVKDGSKWRLLHHGQDMHCGNIKTKRGAELAADGFANRSIIELAKWDGEYLAIASGAEGVTFKYSTPATNRIW